MKWLKLALVALAVVFGASCAQQKASAPAPAAKKEEKKMMPSPAVEKYARDFLAQWSNDANLQKAIKASTAKNRKLDYDEIRAQDWLWQIGRTKGKTDDKSLAARKKLDGQLAEVGVKDSTEQKVDKGEQIIKDIRGNATSKWLIEKKEATKGAITEIFVMDGVGWNVGQTDGTSDFYQGDEGKWQKTFASSDPNGVEVLPIEEEDGIRYAQISLPIREGNKNIGAVTIGVDVDKVK